MKHHEDVADATNLGLRDPDTRAPKTLALNGFRMRLTRAALRQALFGLAATGLGIFAAIMTTTFPVGFSYDSAGPRLFPGIVAAGLILAGLASVADAVTSESSEDDEEYDILPVALVSGTLLGQIFILKWVGWPPCAAMVFAATAWVMGSRNLVRDLAIGLAFGLVTLLVFNFGLGLKLPIGVFAALFPVE